MEIFTWYYISQSKMFQRGGRWQSVSNETKLCLQHNAQNYPMRQPNGSCTEINGSYKVMNYECCWHWFPCRGREGTRQINTPCMWLNCPLWFYSHQTSCRPSCISQMRRREIKCHHIPASNKWNEMLPSIISRAYFRQKAHFHVYDFSQVLHFICNCLFQWKVLQKVKLFIYFRIFF